MQQEIVRQRFEQRLCLVEQYELQNGHVFRFEAGDSGEFLQASGRTIRANSFRIVAKPLDVFPQAPPRFVRMHGVLFIVEIHKLIHKLIVRHYFPDLSSAPSREF